MSKNNGGAAFPSTEANYHNENMRSDGMSLRDYFAAKEMSGLMANEEAIHRFRTASMSEGFESATLMATAAFFIADAMLAERAK